MQPRRAPQISQRTLFVALATWSFGCVSMSLPSWSSPSFRHAAAPVSPVIPRPTRRFTVVDARVDAKRRIVGIDGAPLALETRLATLVRELSENGQPTVGTTIRLVYAGPADGSSVVGRGTLVAVEVGDGEDAQRIFYHEDESASSGDFYARDGRAACSSMLRYPVPLVRITSGFSASRRHPVLKKHKPHLGVDFAAPRGTPVIAVGDGEIVEAAWRGGFGRLIRISHEGGLESGYAHLDRFAHDIATGRHVRKGDVIGYVGRTGLATGPHLHFSLRRDGEFVDPLATPLPKRRPLVAGALRALAASVAEVETALAYLDENSVRYASFAAIGPVR